MDWQDSTPKGEGTTQKEASGAAQEGWQKVDEQQE
jgi:hypothetical protein